MDYTIYFDSRTSGEDLCKALVNLFGLAPESIYIGDQDALADYSGPDPIVVIYPGQPEPGFSCELGAGQDLANAAANISELELAKKLCAAVAVDALIDGGDDNPDVWLLVDKDGNHGTVVIDEDAADDGNLVIAYAPQPIPGHPDISTAAQ